MPRVFKNQHYAPENGCATPAAIFDNEVNVSVDLEGVDVLEYFDGLDVGEVSRSGQYRLFRKEEETIEIPIADESRCLTDMDGGRYYSKRLTSMYCTPWTDRVQELNLEI